MAVRHRGIGSDAEGGGLARGCQGWGGGGLAMSALTDLALQASFTALAPASLPMPGLGGP